MRNVTWDYLTTPADALTDERLNELGADGWELVTVHDGTAIFKRVGPNYRERMTIAQREQLDAQLREAGP